ncbi:MucR family transcriptional regulator [Sagittula salina]|uniref:MucR family transcriptional regulator n=1 Tax=Sagittula salina TaxID=2820268 RepID=A0A940MMG2_9RHOB|nr:MucR family transcriptional regulator [Sagittula salina]MBP0484570.1 MucR family transcriptional regulator [Sagittula salina]
MAGQEDTRSAIGRIVAAYASRPDVGPDDIVQLYHRLSDELTGPSAVAADTVVQGRPALSPESAVTEDKVYCLCCGRGFKMLKRHLGSEHGMTEAAYRATFGLAEDVPLVAPSYSRKKAAHAKAKGLGKYDRSPVGQD